MKAIKLVLLLSIFGVLCALGAAQPSGYSSSSSMGSMYTSSQHPSYDWLGSGYRYHYYPYYYNYYPYSYSYYYPYSYSYYYPYSYSYYYPYSYSYYYPYSYSYPWYSSGYNWGY